MPSSHPQNSIATKDHQQWSDVTYHNVPFKLPFNQRRLFWLGLILRMCAELISKSLLHGELVVCKRNRDRQKLRFKEVCKRNLKRFKVTTGEWEMLANDRAKWKSTWQKRLKKEEMRGRINFIYLYLFVLFTALLCLKFIFSPKHN